MAAGLGFKDFTTGEVLTAADVDGYLMQGVWVFASAAARDAAVTSPQEGNFAYLKDTNVTTYYTGSAWANLDTTGMTNPMTTTGDIIYSSSGSTPARLGIGSTGNVLTVSGGVPAWAAPAGGGKVLQVVEGILSGNAGSTSATYSDLGLSVSITPSLTSSKVLVFATCSNVGKTAANTYVGLRLMRDTTQIAYQDYVAYNAAATALQVGTVSLVKLDSPSTTSATTYKVQINNGAATGTTLVNEYATGANDKTSTIIAMEIGA